jgi:hypothetical protein
MREHSKKNNFRNPSYISFERGSPRSVLLAFSQSYVELFSNDDFNNHIIFRGTQKGCKRDL